MDVKIGSVNLVLDHVLVIVTGFVVDFISFLVVVLLLSVVDFVVSTSGSVASTVVVASTGFVVLVVVFLLENGFVFSLVVDKIVFFVEVDIVSSI
jgi:hypothetical protein